MTSRQDPTFGISIAEVFRLGIVGYRRNVLPLTLAALGTLGTYAAFRITAQIALNADQLGRSLAFDIVGLVVAGVAAFPWYFYALDAADHRPVDVGAPFRNLDRLPAQFVASVFFWAGVLLGFRYLFGIPSIVIAVLYAFYGFVIADGRVKGAMRALGTSVALGVGKRLGIFAIAGLFLVFNFFGATALGFAVNPGTIVLAVAGVAVTSSITMVAGATVYRRLQAG